MTSLRSASPAVNKSTFRSLGPIGAGNWSQSIQVPLIKAGHWSAWRSQNASSHNFSGHDVWLCFSEKTCLKDGLCATGRIGRACDECLPGWYGGADGECQPCTRSPWEQALVLCALMVIGVPCLLSLIIQLFTKTGHQSGSEEGLQSAHEIALSSFSALRVTHLV